MRNNNGGGFDTFLSKNGNKINTFWGTFSFNKGNFPSIELALGKKFPLKKSR
jgi:hypothetical protein